MQISLGHFMDTKEACKDASQDLARKSLIEISNSLPDEVKHSDVHETCASKDRVQVVDSEEADKYRSELISISYSQSSDITSAPAALAKP